MPNGSSTQKQKNPLVDACGEFLRRRHGRNRTSEQEDVTQDAILRALSASRPGAVHSPLNYMFGIARNLLVDRKRRQLREDQVHQSLSCLAHGSVEAHNPERIISARQDLARISAAIDALPPRCREAFLLHRFEHLSYSAIARRMGVSTGTVEKHIALAMLKIATAMHISGGRK